MRLEHETVALTHDLPEHGLVTGDVGAIVYCYSGGKAYEVEFVAANGRPWLLSHSPRPMGARWQGAKYCMFAHLRQLGNPA